MLNNLAKYRTRDLPSLMWHVEKEGKLPEALTLALAANLICADVADSKASLADKNLWGEDLTQIPGLLEAVQHYAARIQSEGVLSVVESIL